MKTTVSDKQVQTILQELLEALGPEKVKTDDITLVAYGRDVSPQPYRKPAMVIFPESRDDVKNIMLIANKNKFPVTVQSAGVSTTGLTLPAEKGAIIDLRRMNKVIEINTDSGYAVIEAGVSWDKFIIALSAKGYRCHISTAPGGASVVGNSLLKPSGSLANKHLDSIIDLEVVLPDGTVVNTGSSHFEDCGHGLRYGPFPDLTGLYCCSYGTLGIVTQASIRIYPRNEAAKVAVASFDSFASAIDFVKDIINHNIPEHCIIWSWQLYKTFEISDPSKPVVELPADLTMDPSKPDKGTPYCLVTVHLSGYEVTVKAGEEACSMAAAKYGGKLLSDAEARKFVPGSMAGWDILYVDYNSLVPLVLFGKGQYMAWIVQTEPANVKELEKWALGEISKLGVRPVEYYAQPFDFGRSIFFRIFCFPEYENKALIENVGKRYREMYYEAMKKYHAIPFRFRPGQEWINETGGYGDLLTRIKKAVDPNNILNPHTTLFKEAK